MGLGKIVFLAFAFCHEMSGVLVLAGGEGRRRKKEHQQPIFCLLCFFFLACSQLVAVAIRCHTSSTAGLAQGRVCGWSSRFQSAEESVAHRAANANSVRLCGLSCSVVPWLCSPGIRVSAGPDGPGITVFEGDFRVMICGMQVYYCISHYLTYLPPPIVQEGMSEVSGCGMEGYQDDKEAFSFC